MVFDTLDHAAHYRALGKGIQKALDWYLAFVDDGAPLPARTELEPGKIWINGVNYETAANPAPLMEAHQNYIDVMYVVEGEERFYYKPFANVSEITMPYDSEKECALAKLDPDSNSLRFTAGKFVIFFPQDGHLAAQLWDKPCKVRKFIAKVAVDSL
ncbi:MAG: YhcH/YjgK/YiaL family protein [Clostridiaceae bacterium]